jgi:ATP-binding cassette subfamily B protein
MRLSLKRGSLEDLLTQKDGLDYFLNEQAQLSTGQKQRLSIARAILRNPSLLILDEATSNLDKETENQIVHMLKEFATDRISIIVSHRNSFDSMATNQLLLIRKTS